jgi:DNA invertase Pin-like site-specific DNA recombinase
MVQGETYERTYEEVTPAKRGRKPKVVVERDGNGRAKITEAVEARVRELSDNLRTAKYIADKLGIGQTTVKDILRRTEHVPV